MNTNMQRVERWKTVVESLVTGRTGLAAFRRELANAEDSGELPEFYVLSFQAVASTIEDSEFATDYLEMAEALASSPSELALAAENWAGYELRRRNFRAAADRCLTALEQFDQTAGLWKNLLLALHGLGEVDMIDVVLRGFAQTIDGFTAELVRSLATRPGLRSLQARPAFRDLVARRCPSLAMPSPGFRTEFAAGELAALRSVAASADPSALAGDPGSDLGVRLVTFLRRTEESTRAHPVMHAVAAEDAAPEAPGSRAAAPAPLASAEVREGRREHDASARAPKRSHDRVRDYYRDLQEAVQYGYVDLGVAPVEAMDG